MGTSQQKKLTLYPTADAKMLHIEKHITSHHKCSTDIGPKAREKKLTVNDVGSLGFD